MIFGAVNAASISGAIKSRLSGPMDNRPKRRAKRTMIRARMEKTTSKKKRSNFLEKKAFLKRIGKEGDWFFTESHCLIKLKL